MTAGKVRESPWPLARHNGQWNTVEPPIETTIGNKLAVLYTVEPLYRDHHWEQAGCPVYSGTSL